MLRIAGLMDCIEIHLWGLLTYGGEFLFYGFNTDLVVDWSGISE